MNKVICIGEALIDFIPTDKSMGYVAKAGGAPSNVCACVAKLGGKGCFLGKLSGDGFGKFLLTSMQKANVDTEFAIVDNRYSTALAVVTLSDDGDREFSFYRDNTADVMLDKSEIKEDMFEKGDILHFCSVGLVESPSKYAHVAAIDIAKKKGAMISFDVNVRLGLWGDEEKCKDTINQFLIYPDIVKVTDDELTFLTNEKNEAEGVRQLLSLAKNCKIIFVTKGKNGASVYDRSLVRYDRDAVQVEVVDTTGAGDCFSGCILYSLALGKAELTTKGIKDAVDFASYGSAVVIGRRGAMEAMPTLDEVKALKNSIK